MLNQRSFALGIIYSIAIAIFIAYILGKGGFLQSNDNQIIFERNPSIKSDSSSKKSSADPRATSDIAAFAEDYLAECFKDFSENIKSFYTTGWLQIRRTEAKKIIASYSGIFELIHKRAIQEDPANFSSFAICALNTKHKNTCYYESAMQLFLACKDYCTYITTTDFDEATQPLSFILKNYLTELAAIENLVSFDQTPHFEKMHALFQPRHNLESMEVEFDAAEYVQSIFERLEYEETNSSMNFFTDNKNILQDVAQTENGPETTLTQPGYVFYIRSLEDNMPLSGLIKAHFMIPEAQSTDSDTPPLEIQRNYSLKSKYFVAIITHSDEHVTEGSHRLGRLNIPRNFKSFPLDDSITLSGKTYCPKNVICYLGNYPGRVKRHYVSYTFTEGKCYRLEFNTRVEVDFDRAFEEAYEKAVAVLYERIN